MSKSVIARIIVLLIMLFNQFLIAIGHAPLDLDENAVYTTVSDFLTIVWALWCAWKDTPVTPEAIAANRLMHEMKANRGSEDDGLYEQPTGNL